VGKIIVVILTKIVNPVITVMFVVALVVFLWGIFKFVASEEGGEDHTKGKSAMVWGIVGFLIMVGVYGILAFVKSSIGL